MNYENDPDVVAFDDGTLDTSRLRPSDVKIGREPKSNLAVRFDGADLDRLRQRAEAEGVGVTQLVRTWVLERLDEPPATSALGDLMASLEASLRAARTIKRSIRTP